MLSTTPRFVPGKEVSMRQSASGRLRAARVGEQAQVALILFPAQAWRACTAAARL
jgi:hypothetical protein